MIPVPIIALALAGCAVVMVFLATRWTRKATRDRQHAALLLTSTRRRPPTRRC